MAEHPPSLDLSHFAAGGARHRREQVARNLMRLAAYASILVSVLIVVSLVGGAVDFLGAIDPGQLRDTGWFPRRDKYDLSSLVMSTLYVTGVAIAVAGPLGLGVAIYLSEYANPRVRRVVKPAIEMIAGIPSVVIGLFALTFITPELIQPLRERTPLSNLLAAGIGVGILTLPIIASIAEDAMRAVPRSLREGAYGLGARKATVSLRVVVPAALSGIMAAFIVGVSRAIGETMVVALAAGTNGTFPEDVFSSGLTMTGAIANLAIGSDQVRAGGDAAFQSLFFVALLLFFLTLLLNVLSDRIVRRFRERY